jgi:DNA-binding SARP family transcriptional activator/tetratricopeptide (TPR) repeat protein
MTTPSPPRTAVGRPDWQTDRGRGYSAPVRFRILGPVEIESDDGQVHTLGRRQERCLLAILLLDAGRFVTVDRLCDLLWDDNPPGQARRTVHAHVARIRARFTDMGGGAADPQLLSRPGGYLLRVERDAVDAHRFRHLLDRATDCTDLHQREQLLHECLALWRGPALHKAAVSDRQRQRLCAGLEEQRMQAVEASLAVGLDLGRHRELLPELARLNAEHPIREHLVALHMLALYRHGRTSEALDAYHHARTRLADELGLDPGAALQQLHHAILRGEPLPATAAPPRSGGGITPALLPASLSTFTGRNTHLDRLDRLLADNTTAVVISAIAGTAGIGKTALALHWAHRVRDRFPDGQLYVNLRGFDPTGPPTPPGNVVRRFLDALGVPTHRIPIDPDAQIDLYRSLLATKRVLVILDNARDADQARPLLPGAPGCFALVASRNRLTGLVAIDGAHPLVLDVLTPDEAHQLLAARIGADRVAAEPDAIDEIIHRCARLPLALAIAAARATTDPHLCLADLAAELRDAHHRLDALTGGDTATDIRAVFACSYHTLTPHATRLFRLLGLHPGPDVSSAAAASLAGVAHSAVEPLLDELARAHLLAEVASGRYAFHDLLHAYAIELVHTHDTHNEHRIALHRMLDHYLHTANKATHLVHPHRDPIDLAPALPGVTQEDVTDREQANAWLTAEHHVLMAAIRQAADRGFDTHALRLALSLTGFLDYRGHWSDLEAVHNVATAAAHRLGNRSAQAQAHRGLAVAYTRLGRYDDARTNFRHALDMFNALQDRIGRAHTHRLRGWLLDLQGQYRDALDEARQALDLYRDASHRTGEAAALNLVGWYHAQLGDHSQAVAYCEQALTAHQALGNLRGESADWDSLGYAEHHLGHHHRAIACYGRAIKLRQELGDRYNEATALAHLGDTHCVVGDHGAASAAWQQALSILTELDHPDADRVRTKLHDLQPRKPINDRQPRTGLRPAPTLLG